MELFDRHVRLPILIAATLLIGAPAPGFAQWLNYPTTGIPRLANGKPNLNAPAPRTSDAKPDLSGIWAWEDNRPCPPDGCPDAKVGQEFISIGWSLKNGLPYQPWAADLVKARRAANSKDDPHRGACRGAHSESIPTDCSRRSCSFRERWLF